MTSDSLETIVLGPEYDEELRARLKRVLKDMGARQKSKLPWVPDLEVVEVDIEGDRVKVESETYMGLSITGPSRLVKKIADRVKASVRTDAPGA